MIDSDSNVLYSPHGRKPEYLILPVTPAIEPTRLAPPFNHGKSLRNVTDAASDWYACTMPGCTDLGHTQKMTKR